MHRVALVVLHLGVCLFLLSSSALDAVIKAGGGLSGKLFQHVNSSSVLVEHQSLYHVRGINVVLL